MEIGDFATRKEGLENYLTILEKRVKGDFPRKETFLTIIECLKKFGNEQFKYFKDNFSRGILEDSDEFPYENVLTTILDQIGYDIALIEKAINQRNSNDPQKTLEIADHLAYLAINPMLSTTDNVKGLRLRSKLTVLTYFQKSTNVRVIPYAPIVLVGIPFTSLKARRDFLAIPHEIGHYIYRHGLFGAENVSSYLRGKDSQGEDRFPDWIKIWVEEIFADVYGALIAGPVIGLSFQDLQLRSTVDNFFNDDGEHPTPLLRPHIYMNIVENAESEIKAWTGLLRSNWSTCLEQKRDNKMASRNRGVIYEEKAPDEYDHAKKRKIKLKNVEKFFKVENIISTIKSPEKNDAKKPLDIIIEKIHYKFLGHIKNATDWPQPPAPNTAVPNVNDLYTHFENYIEKLIDIPSVPELTIDEQSAKIFVGGNPTHLDVGKIIVSPDEPPPSRPASQEKIETKEWLKTLDARGWTTKGPDCEGAGSCGGG